MPKRKHLRADANILIDLFSADAVANIGRGCVVNISLGGLAIETESLLGIDTEILMDMKLPDVKHSLEIYAIVIRQQDLGNVFRYGLRYTRISILQRIKLYLYIHGWLKQYGSPSGKKEE